jgi:ABC-type sugar transport system ATPase subunit
VISLQGLEVQAADFHVGPIDLAVPDATYGVLLGPSGAGKSLVLEAAAGVRPIRGGRVEIDGRDVTALPPERRSLGLVFQDGLLFPHLDVAANIAYGVKGAGLHSPSVKDRVSELAEETGVTELLARRPSTLSGGERQRVALARALAARPRALLLDEPLSSVDGGAREELQQLLCRLCRAEDLSMLHVTHDIAEAFALGDTCAVLIDGHVRQTGPPAEVLRRPGDADVARFFGARNVLAGRRRSDDGYLVELSPAMLLRLADPAPSDDVLVVLRPEDLEIVPAEGSPRGEGQRFVGEVVDLVPLGGTTLVRVDLPPRVDVQVPALRAGELGLRPGLRVEVLVPDGALCVLPAEGGRA